VDRSLDEIVNEQVVDWQKRREAFERAPEVFEPAQAQPCIAISMQIGSLGLAAAQQVAERLKFRLYGRELVNLIAETAHVRRSLVESVDGRTQSAIEKWIGHQLGTAFFSEDDYMTNLSQVLLTLSHHGQAVIIGRGAQFLLEPARTLRVRIDAPLELRVSRVAQSEGLDSHDARSKVLHADAEQAAFAHRHFARDVSDRFAYDLLASTEYLNADACADMICAAFRARFG
jgi:hypothetical protein